MGAPHHPASLEARRMLPPWLLPGTSSPGLTVFAAMCRNCPSAGARTTCPTARSTAWPALSLRRTPPAPPSPALMSPPSRCARVVAGLQAPARVHPPADALLAGGGAPVEGAQRGCSRTGASVRVPVVTCLQRPGILDSSCLIPWAPYAPRGIPPCRPAPRAAGGVQHRGHCPRGPASAVQHRAPRRPPCAPFAPGCQAT